MTKTFAVIGDPIDHSLSPTIHNAAFKELEMDCTFIAYRIAKDELEEGIEALKKIQIAGFNVTIPHKIQMMKYLDKTDESCSIIGAVNTVVNEGGHLRGYNTDMDGFLEPIKKRQFNVSGKKILLLGAGGAARAIVSGFAKESAQSVTIANRTIDKAIELSKFSKKLGLESNTIPLESINAPSEYDIIVNATSIGLNGEPSPVSFENIKPNTIVYDIVYRPMNTEFIKQAKKNNATVIYGYEMLLGQATRAFEIWHKTEAPYNAMKRALLGGF